MSRRTQLVLIAGAWVLCALHAGRVVSAIQGAVRGPYADPTVAAVRELPSPPAMRVASR